ncbi:ABC transporter permease [Planctomycetales bacterium 10988]|nr:ABC transporter permease [Planctomycetales bacterium 10988]
MRPFSRSSAENQTSEENVSEGEKELHRWEEVLDEVKFEEEISSSSMDEALDFHQSFNDDHVLEVDFGENSGLSHDDVLSDEFFLSSGLPATQTRSDAETSSLHQSDTHPSPTHSVEEEETQLSNDTSFSIHDSVFDFEQDVRETSDTMEEHPSSSRPHESTVEQNLPTDDVLHEDFLQEEHVHEDDLLDEHEESLLTEEGMSPFVQASMDWIADLGDLMIRLVCALGGVTLFAASIFRWMFTHLPRRETLLPAFYQIGVLSLPVVALTGLFIGMVLAVQTYAQFRLIHLETRLGAVINISLVRELGPVLAATMLAGRVGSAMAAELGTMRVTEQIDALTSMGANPIRYLVVPRFLGCLLLIPPLTVMADFMGVVGGMFYSVTILGVDSHHYWYNSQQYVGLYDLFAGVFKSLFFGAAIAIISCYRGFHCDPGAEGVGRAATGAFVHSFVLILLIDLFLAIFLDSIYTTLWPTSGSLI